VRCRCPHAGDPSPAHRIELEARALVYVVKLAGVAYDVELADRIRYLIGTGPGLIEKKMFGGLAFLIGGNMAISASGQGGALVRVDPAESAALTETTTATTAIMGGREMPGWLRVSADDLETDDQLTEWVSRAIRYTRSLPPKR
jgi:TfoX-like protein